jgi:hypothetical protein
MEDKDKERLIVDRKKFLKVREFFALNEELLAQKKSE